MQTVTTQVPTPDGRTLCVDSAGDPQGRPVFVHAGSPNSRLMFEPWVRDARERGIRLICHDRPGFGGSSPQPGRRVADCAADVRAIAEAFSFERLAVWGYSGGGPHALACAALLPDLVIAVATLASLAPHGGEGLDFYSGMGNSNAEGFRKVTENPLAARAACRDDRVELLEVTLEGLTNVFSSLLSAADLAVLTPDLAAWLVACNRDGLAPGDEGWWDDSVALMGPWGFSVEDIGVPVQVWHGRQDQFVPFQHGQWLAERIPAVEAHLTDGDGHLTLGMTRVPQVHEWLLAHF